MRLAGALSEQAAASTTHPGVTKHLLVGRARQRGAKADDFEEAQVRHDNLT